MNICKRMHVAVEGKKKRKTSPQFGSVWSPTTELETADTCLSALIGREAELPGAYEACRENKLKIFAI